MLLKFFLCLFTIPLATGMGTLDDSNLRAINNIGKPGCQTQCGNVTVPYPFGIGNDTGCALDNRFYLTCNTSGEDNLQIPQLFIQSSNIRIHNISDSELRILTRVAYRCYDQDGTVSNEYNWWTNLAGLFTFSEKNMFTVIGCDDYGLITGKDGDGFSSGCVGLCSEGVDVSDGQCSGKGCCQTSITKGLHFYNVTLNTFRNHTDVWPINNCGNAFLGEEGTFQFGGDRDLSNSSELVERVRSTVFVVLDWVIGQDRTCFKATECKENSSCYDVEGGGYRCKCNKGYEGNPYLDQGCQGILFGLLTLLIGLSTLCLMAKQRKLIKLREKFFEQNGGTLLEDKLKNTSGIGVNSMKIFRVEEMKEATNNYADDRILGKGGNGTVYKGILPENRVVAIKKSQRLDQGQREQFINEMVILTQINHHNVVQLLGCCLETDVPLLVYEFVSNNTLDHHIHNSKSGTGRLSWDSRLRIAHESASALAYLHTDARMSIIHRDVKSTNILLDENYTAKIADFGASRLVPLGHDEVITLVQGTFGYLDPEYFHSGQLTDKSDVYSFGVVLAELLTGKKALGVERCVENRSLATYFVKAKKENRLCEIIDRQVLNEVSDEQLKATCDLVCRCLNQVGGNRPSMKEVTMELETLRKFGKHPWINQDNYNETGKLTTEVEEFDLYPLVANSDTFGKYSSSSTGLMKEMMLQVQDPR